MRTIDELAMDIEVGRDPERASVELRIAGPAGEDARIVHLSREEARRLAALVLFQADRLDRRPAGWRLPYLHPERKSA